MKDTSSVRDGNQVLENCHWNRWVYALVEALWQDWMMSVRGATPGYCFEGSPLIAATACVSEITLGSARVVFGLRISRVLVDILQE